MSDDGGGDNSACLQVISNSLITRRLEKYISYDDLKACRLVCQAFSASIVEGSSFLNRTKLIVKEDTVRSGIFNHQLMSFSPKSIDLYLFEGMTRAEGTEKRPKLTYKDLECVYHCLKDVESLKLHDDDLSRIDNYNNKLPDVSRLIRGTTKPLKELQLSAWDVDLIMSFKSSSKHVVKKLKDVVSLELIPHRDSESAYLSKGQEGLLKQVDKLQRVKIRDGYDACRGRIPEIIELVIRCANTITSLEISRADLWAAFSNVDGISYIYGCEVHFPKLQELRIRGSSGFRQFGVELSKFLAAHWKQLNSLEIRILGVFPADMLDGIRKEARKKLKHLSIATNAFDRSRTGNLAFLEDCHELESFELKFILDTFWYDRCSDSLTDVFSYLPTKNLRKVSLIRLPTPPHSLSLSVEKIKALSGLKYLALDCCGGAVNYITINVIFKYMTNLEYLRVKQASECGVKGFTGTENVVDVTPKPGKVAASNLIHLKHLVLQHCGLNDHIVKVALKFKDLEILDISGNHCVTEASCKVAVSQNPALRVLRTNVRLGKEQVTHLKSLNARFHVYKTAEGVDHDQDPSDDEESESDEDYSVNSSSDSEMYHHFEDYDYDEDPGDDHFMDLDDDDDNENDIYHYHHDEFEDFGYVDNAI